MCDVDSSFDYVNTRGEVMGLKVTKWTPAIFMPRWASRITLEVTGVRVERLHAITDADASAEGVEELDGEYDAAELARCAKLAGSSQEDARGWFAWLWCQINGEESWRANPWVWVVEFKRVEVSAMTLDSRVSEGCRNCYAEVQAARIVRMGKGKPTRTTGSSS
jgi:hypothetical protein